MFVDKWYMNVANRGMKRLRLIFESGRDGFVDHFRCTPRYRASSTPSLFPTLVFFTSTAFYSPPLLLHEVFPSFFTSSSFSLPPSLQYHSLSLSFPWWWMDQCCEETMLLFLQLNKDTHSFDMKAIGESDHRMRGVAKGRTTKAQNCGKIRRKKMWNLVPTQQNSDHSGCRQ